MSESLRIANGRVYDPANGIDGVIGDVLALDGHVVASLPPDAAPRTIDASGLVVMPGGVDMHCHIASSTVNRARAMQGEEHAAHVHPACPARGLRGGSGVLTPSTFLTGYRYAALGYTTAVEAAVAPSAARQSHLELGDTPNLDAGLLLLVANHEKVIELLDAGQESSAVAFIQELLYRTGALGIKVVNPGGVASWRRDARQHIIESIDDPVAGTGRVTPRRLLELAATTAETLGLAHPPHVHCNRLGVAGNVQTTLDTLKALEGRRVHLTHLQFHAYGRGPRGQVRSAAPRVCAALDAHPLVTADVGQVMFGDAVTLTADTPLEHLLHKLVGPGAGRYVSIESELETGCGLMPIRYGDRNILHSRQWAIGLELLLGCSDPWRMVLSTDHPNGGSFLSYPAIIAQLMSKAVRDETLARANRRALSHAPLRDMDRQMSLQEIAIITRAGPARALGLSHKGHLGPGADADVTIYEDNQSDPQAMFTTPRYVIKGGRVLVEDGELRHAVEGRRLRADLAPSPQGQRELDDWFGRRGSYSVSQFGMHPHELEAMAVVRQASSGD